MSKLFKDDFLGITESNIVVHLRVITKTWGGRDNGRTSREMTKTLDKAFLPNWFYIPREISFWE